MAWRKYHTIWFVMAFGWVALYVVRMGISPVLGMIMEEFHISYATAGSLFSAIFLSYTFMQVPSGYLGDRFGRRKILIVSTLLWFFFSLGTALVQSFAMLVILRLLTGIAHGAYFGNEKPTIVAFTPAEKMGQGQAVSFMGLAFGFFLAVFFSGMIADFTNNWRWVFVVFSVPSIITSLLIFKYVHYPEPGPRKAPAEIRAAYKKAFMGRDLWLMYFLGFALLYAYWLLATWMPSIYMEMGISTITASSVLSGILGLVGLPGLFIIGTLSDTFSERGFDRKWFIAGSALMWTLLMLAMAYAVETRCSSAVITILYLTSGFFAFGVWPPYYALLGDLAPKGIIGTTFGLANLIGFLSSWVAPFFTGWIKDTTGSFAGGMYVAAFVLMAGVILILSVKKRPMGITSGEIN
ncbi:MAG: MFS transporter [Deltaproteobacteria bacterium]|nr:MFS transporter [Deltaproteobacteria bacterium]